MNPSLRDIPPVHELLEAAQIRELVERVGRGPVVAIIRQTLDDLRNSVLENGNGHPLIPARGQLIERVIQRVHEQTADALRPVINATGVLLHTGLGRAPLADEALEAMTAVARDYSNVEFDLSTGERSRRKVAVESLLRELTGAEAALVVNNNAGATLLALTALASGKEVVVSRGQLIEIGGGYRLPEVMTASGCKLREVGTTNKTRIDDYATAVTPDTAALLLVHPSNYVVLGFSQSVSLGELVPVARRAGIPLIHDIGSGAMFDFARFGLRDEPIVTESVRSGADVVLFSGDKLLGGPQAGIILARQSLLSQIEKHPLARALRVDKLTLAALAATLRLYRDPELAIGRIPLLQMLNASVESLFQRAALLSGEFEKLSSVATATPMKEVARVGGGSVPGQEVPDWCVAVTPRALGVEQLADQLRRGSPALVGRVKNDQLLIHLRTVPPRQDAAILQAFRQIAIA